MTGPSANSQESQQGTADWRTWSPFQSKTVRDICANMTPSEKSSVTRRGMIYGVWVAISAAFPLQFIILGLVTGNLNPILNAVGGFLIVAHICVIPIWQRHVRQFLCNTMWARENGIEAESLKLFNWHSTKPT